MLFAFAVTGLGQVTNTATALTLARHCQVNNQYMIHLRHRPECQVAVLACEFVIANSKGQDKGKVAP